MVLKYNLPILICITFLLSIGILVIYSSSKELALQQLIFALVGLGCYFLVSGINNDVFKSFVNLGFVITLILLILVLILGIETRGSIRWLPLGKFNIQPSEFAKPVLILFLADYWSQHRPTWANIFKNLAIMSLPILLIFKQPDLGTTLTIIFLSAGMLFLANVSLKKVAILALVVVLAFPLVWFSLHDYQRQRIVSFVSPGSDPLGQGYNVIQSTIAVGSGEFLGRGLGHGTQSRLQFLPEFRTDFIFAAIAEELGFLGGLLIITIYGALVFYCLKVALSSREVFGFLVAAGVGINILFQVIVNIGMNVGLLPITGITLPMISYGGSSLIATLISLGFVANASKQRRKFDISSDSS